jgi:hypothetical protein
LALKKFTETKTKYHHSISFSCGLKYQWWCISRTIPTFWCLAFMCFLGHGVITILQTFIFFVYEILKTQVHLKMSNCRRYIPCSTCATLLKALNDPYLRNPDELVLNYFPLQKITHIAPRLHFSAFWAN